MITVERTEEWRSWHGSLRDLATVAAAAEELISKWIKGSVAASVTVEGVGLKLLDLTPDELACLTITDVPRIERIAFDVGSLGGPRVSVYAQRWTEKERRPAVVLSILGDDRVRVDGLAAELTRMLDRGSRFIRRYSSTGAPLVSLPFIVAAAVGAITVADRTRATNVHAAVWTAFGLFLLGIFTFCTSIPELEIHEPGEQTRFQRMRAIIGGVALAVVGAVIAAVLLGQVG